MTHSLTNAWPWPVRPLYWVYFLLDWLDVADRPDHGKVQVDAVIWCALWLHYLDEPLSLGALIAVLSASFGARMWLALLKSKSLTSTETVTVDRKVVERRKSGDFEVTP